MSITTKKIQLIPLGDKEEVNRVYQYLRDGIYNQYHMLNIYMGELASLFYSSNMDTESEMFKKGYEKIFSETNDVYKKLEGKKITAYVNGMDKHVKKLKEDLKDAEKNIGSEEYKDRYNKIFRNTNNNIKSIKQAKGLGMSGNCGMRVKADFKTALKNGLASGERQVPFYKRDFPLLAPNRFLRFYNIEDKYINKEGKEVESKGYAIKFVNGIHFKVILGSMGRRDLYVNSLLDNIINDPENYHVSDSSISITKKGKIMLNLTVKINKTAEIYEPVPGRVMGLSMGYDKCLVAAISDNDKEYSIGDYAKDSIVKKRQDIQLYRQQLQIDLRDNARGGHGRKRKLTKTYNEEAYEKNMIRHFNHVLSKSVIKFAKNHKVQVIIIEDIEKSDLEAYPVLLRNWSYYQLQQFITYKAGKDIDVRISKNIETARKVCCKCGCELKEENIIPKKIEWCGSISFTCPECGETVEYSYNKAKNMTVYG